MFPRLLADIGGTNIRLATQQAPGSPLSQVGRYACASFATLEEAIRHHLSQTGQALPPAAALGVATAVDGDWVRMTNHSWEFSQAGLRQALGLQRLVVVNDFTALALAVPQLQSEDLQLLRSGRAVEGAACAVIGPGTGLGMAAVLPRGAGRPPIALDGEGGHATLGSNEAQEHAVLQILGRRYGHVSAERALCGQGLVDIHQALRELREVHEGREGREPALVSSPLTPQALLQAALSGEDALAQEAVAMFCALLGQVAGNAALTYGARGGVYIAGGIVPRLGALFEQSAFKQRFVQKGRLTGYVEQIPVYLVQATEMAALKGASVALDAALG
ncbi:MAG TPA: glucokinase [Burkholderiaceae bacterium]|nr:glucokinase [Burkholderiaceae bacterium]